MTRLRQHRSVTLPFPLSWLAAAGLAVSASACQTPVKVTPQAPATIEAPAPQALTRFTSEHSAMGTLFRATVYAQTEELATAGMEAAFRAVDEIEVAATDYDKTSEARRLGELAQGAEPYVLSPELARVMRAADEVVRLSGGAFDPTIGALTPAWRRALRRRAWPDGDAWRKDAERVGWQSRVNFDQGSGSVRFTADSMRVDFGGVAKGVAVDAALEALAALGIDRALIDGGGDLAASGPPPGEPGWRVSVQPSIEVQAADPQQPRAVPNAGPSEGAGESSTTSARRVLLAHGAVATSGDAYQNADGFEGAPLDGLHANAGLATEAKRFGHVLDPRTALPLPGPRASIVFAPSAALADGLATALLVAGANGTKAPPFEMAAFWGPEGQPCFGAGFPQDEGALIAFESAPTSFSQDTSE